MRVDSSVLRGRALSTTAVTLAIGATLVAGCGGSSKPSYCGAVSNLENSIKALPSTNVIQNGVSGLESALSKVQDDANKVVSSAKSDFPTETAAVKSSVDALSGTVKQLKSSPAPATIAQLPGQIAAVATAVKGFTSATSSKCK
jgi:hypothetical protein